MSKDDYEVNTNETELKERKRWLFFGLPFTFTVYEIGSKALTVRSGLFTTVENQIRLYRILDLTYTRSFFQKLVGLGSIKIYSSDKTNPEFTIKNIKHSKLFKDRLDENIERERIRNRMRTGELVVDSSDSDDDDNIF